MDSQQAIPGNVTRSKSRGRDVGSAGPSQENLPNACHPHCLTVILNERCRRPRGRKERHSFASANFTQQHAKKAHVIDFPVWSSFCLVHLVVNRAIRA